MARTNRVVISLSMLLASWIKLFVYIGAKSIMSSIDFIAITVPKGYTSIDLHEHECQESVMVIAFYWQGAK